MRPADAIELDVDSEGSISTNAVEVARAIGAAPGPVTLVTHSKGSLDALAALVANPALAPTRVQAWVSLQGPFYGSPLADLNSGDPLVRALTGYLLEKGFGGSPDTLLEIAGQRAAHLPAGQCGRDPRRRAGGADGLLRQLPDRRDALAVPAHLADLQVRRRAAQ